MSSLKGQRRVRGIAAVETALVLPLVLLLTLGVMEYSWFFWQAQQASSAAREAARCGARADANTADATARLSSVMTSAGLGNSGYTSTITPSNLAAATSGQVITVQITIPYSNIALFNTPFIPTPTQIRTSVSMAKEGP